MSASHSEYLSRIRAETAARMPELRAQTIHRGNGIDHPAPALPLENPQTSSTRFSMLRATGGGAYWLLPVTENQKTPAKTGWQDLASRDPLDHYDWSMENPNRNVGIFAEKYRDTEALIVLDLDVKDGKDGIKFLAHYLAEQHLTLPATRTHTTPSGGQHLLFYADHPVKSSTNFLGTKAKPSGIDVRSHGAFIVGAGRTAQGIYTADATPIAKAPQWLIDLCGAPRTRNELSNVVLSGIDAAQATDRVIDYLAKHAPVAFMGAGGDALTYRVAAHCKDLGVLEEECITLLDNHWNDRCEPPWSYDELCKKVRHAYKYGLSPVGSAAPEVIFTPQVPAVNDTRDPVLALNQEFSFVLMGGDARVLWETTDAIGRPQLKHLSLPSFRAKLAPKKLLVGAKESRISDLWMESKERRDYDGLVFMPGQPSPNRFFNLWTGFAYEPADPGATHPAVTLWLEHARLNICGGDDTLLLWVLSFLAHLIQRPWEKPSVALVLQGSKGVGKNCFIHCVTGLLGRHGLVVADRRYIIGNFNGHLEHCLMLVLDEAFWSGDKPVEGILKNLITGKEHVIEHKGLEPYVVANSTRIVIMGNEDWLVPASHDERRYAVCEVGEGRKQDTKFFGTMVQGMEQGGYPVLLRYLLDFECGLVDLNKAPATAALGRQKNLTLDPLPSWWLECLEKGCVVGYEHSGWPEEIDCGRFRAAFRRYTNDRNITGRIPADNSLGRTLKKYAPGFDRTKGRVQEDGSRPWVYRLPGLDIARARWELYMGHSIKWSD